MIAQFTEDSGPFRHIPRSADDHSPQSLLESGSNRASREARPRGPPQGRQMCADRRERRAASPAKRDQSARGRRRVKARRVRHPKTRAGMAESDRGSDTATTRPPDDELPSAMACNLLPAYRDSNGRARRRGPPLIYRSPIVAAVLGDHRSLEEKVSCRWVPRSMIADESVIGMVPRRASVPKLWRE